MKQKCKKLSLSMKASYTNKSNIRLQRKYFWMKSGSEEAPQLILPTFEKTKNSFQYYRPQSTNESQTQTEWSQVPRKPHSEFCPVRNGAECLMDMLNNFFVLFWSRAFDWHIEPLCCVSVLQWCCALQVGTIPLLEKSAWWAYWAIGSGSPSRSVFVRCL